MNDNPLYQIFENHFARRELAQMVSPDSIKDNLKYNIRPYQKEAFNRFIYLYESDIPEKDFPEKPKKPLHLLFNMATGSGKTMIMAGLILYLYEKGYRNFLFFVNSNNIIEKTKDNFLNARASKYLFNEKIMINNIPARIKKINNFDEASKNNINIKFTTIQQLHIDLQTPKENSVTLEHFKDKKIALIADEAHHLSATTKQGELIAKPRNLYSVFNPFCKFFHLELF